MSPKAQFLTPDDILAEMRAQERTARRLIARMRRGRSAHDNATGVGFRPDESTTKAVMRRMKEIGAWE